MDTAVITIIMAIMDTTNITATNKSKDTRVFNGNRRHLGDQGHHSYQDQDHQILHKHDSHSPQLSRP